MGDKIDKKVKERVKKFEKKYQEIRKKHANISRIHNLGISLGSYLISELKSDTDSLCLKDIIKEIPQDILKKHSMDKNADFIIKKAETDNTFTKILLNFLQEYYLKDNIELQQELHFFFDENKGVGIEIAESMEYGRDQYQKFYMFVSSIASEFGYVPKPTIISSHQQPLKTNPAAVTTKTAEVKPTVEVKKPVEVKKTPEVKPTAEVKKPVEVKKTPEKMPVPEIKPTLETKKVAELKLEDFSMNMLYPLRNFLNLFNPKLCTDYSKKKIEDLDSFIDVLEIPKDYKASLRNFLIEYLKLMKNVIEDIKKYKNFIPFLLTAEYIGTLLEIKQVSDIINYTLAAEDKAQISDKVVKYEFTNVQPSDCFKFWEKSTMEEREQIAIIVLQKELIRKDMISILGKINALHPILKILDYWNTLKDYIEIPNLVTWIQKSL